MKTITKIEVQKRDKNRCSIFINEEFAFGVEINDVIKYGIQKGNTYNDKEYEELLKKLQYEKAKSSALKYISYSPRSIKQTRDKLYSLDYEENIIDTIIEELKGYKYLNDKEYARSFIRNAILHKRHGTDKIVFQLNNAGVSSDIAYEILDEYKDKEYLQAKYLYEKRAKGRIIKDPKERAKITRYLQGRGYKYQMINEIFNEYS